MRSLPDPALVREVLDYNPDTGLFIWLLRAPRHFTDGRVQNAAYKCKAWNEKWAGSPALTADDGNGYRVGNLFGRITFAHRAAWAHFYGVWPDRQLDHIDGNRAGNWIANLRLATDAVNRMNTRIRVGNKFGVHGISQVPSGRYAAEIKAHGVRRYLGAFDTIQAATSARKAAEADLGFHPNHGRTG